MNDMHTVRGLFGHPLEPADSSNTLPPQPASLDAVTAEIGQRMTPTRAADELTATYSGDLSANDHVFEPVWGTRSFLAANTASADVRNLRLALKAITQAEHIADSLGDLDDNPDPGAVHRVAAYGRTFLGRAYQHASQLTFYCTGSRLDCALRRQLAAARGKL